MNPKVSLQDLVRFLLEDGILPSEVCEAMSKHYQRKVDFFPEGRVHAKKRWNEIKEACDQATQTFVKIHI